MRLTGTPGAWGRFPLRVGNGCFHKNWVTPSCDRYWAGTSSRPWTLFLLQKNANFAFRGSSRNALRQESLRQTSDALLRILRLVLLGYPLALCENGNSFWLFVASKCEELAC